MHLNNEYLFYKSLAGWSVDKATKDMHLNVIYVRCMYDNIKRSEDKLKNINKYLKTSCQIIVD